MEKYILICVNIYDGVIQHFFVSLVTRRVLMVSALGPSSPSPPFPSLPPRPSTVVGNGERMLGLGRTNPHFNTSLESIHTTVPL